MTTATSENSRVKLAALAAILGAGVSTGPLDEAGEGNQFDVSERSLAQLIEEGNANATSAQIARDLLTVTQAALIANGISLSSVTAKRVTGHVFSIGGAIHQAIDELITKASDADAAEQEDPVLADEPTETEDFEDFAPFGGCGCSKHLDI